MQTLLITENKIKFYLKYWDTGNGQESGINKLIGKSTGFFLVGNQLRTSKLNKSRNNSILLRNIKVDTRRNR